MTTNAAEAETGHSPRTERRLVWAFWTILALLWAAKAILTPVDPAGARAGAAAQVAVAFGISYAWALATPAVFRLARRWPVERRAAAGTLLLHGAVALAVAAAAKVWASGLRALLLPGVFTKGAAGSVWGALAQLHFLDELMVYAAILATGVARDYFLRLQQRQAESARLATEAAHLQAQLGEARLRALRMQLNPHFLFNTLHGISALVDRDPAGVRRMIARLSELLRYALDGSGQPEVPLAREMAFVDGYLEIMQVRFGDRLRVRREVDPAAAPALVPSLILQPLVENAVEHGAARNEGGTRVEIHATRRDGRLVLAVSNDGPASAAASPRREGVGLENTRARLEATYGADATLRAGARAEGGWLSEVELPFHTAADLRAGG